VIEGLAERGFAEGQGLLGGSALVKARAQRALLIGHALLTTARLGQPFLLIGKLARLVGDPSGLPRQLGLLLACPQLQLGQFVPLAATRAPGQPEENKDRDRGGDSDGVGRRNPDTGPA
jgi:hypothetical protein